MILAQELSRVDRETNSSRKIKTEGAERRHAQADRRQPPQRHVEAERTTQARQNDVFRQTEQTKANVFKDPEQNV